MTVANAKITTNSLALAMGYFSRQARVWPRRAAGHRISRRMFLRGGAGEPFRGL